MHTKPHGKSAMVNMSIVIDPRACRMHFTLFFFLFNFYYAIDVFICFFFKFFFIAVNRRAVVITRATRTTVDIK